MDDIDFDSQFSTMREGSLLFCEDSSGIYIPQRFANEILRSSVLGVSPYDWQILAAGPDNELYWQVWDDVMKHAIVINRKTGITYTLYQDGDLWLIPENES